MGGREARTFPTGVSAKPGQGHSLCSRTLLKEGEEFLAVVAEGKSCLCICLAANRWLRSETVHYSAPALFAYLAPAPIRKGVKPITLQHGSFPVARKALTHSVPHLWGHWTDVTPQCPTHADTGSLGWMLGLGMGPQTLPEPPEINLAAFFPGIYSHYTAKDRAEVPHNVPSSLLAHPRWSPQGTDGHTGPRQRQNQQFGGAAGNRRRWRWGQEGMVGCRGAEDGEDGGDGRMEGMEMERTLTSTSSP